MDIRRNDFDQPVYGDRSGRHGARPEPQPLDDVLAPSMDGSTPATINVGLFNLARKTVPCRAVRQNRFRGGY